MSHWEIPFSQLEFGTKLGEGSFGAVYTGNYLKTPVAIKKLFFTDDDFMLKYIEREMELLTAVHHPNIVRLMGLCVETNDIYIIMEFISGGNLRSKLKEKNLQMDWPLRIEVALQVARAMAYLHSKDIIHRDLKSHNLLVADGWKVKICDFGLARQQNEGEEEVKNTIEGTIVGTDFWMAPEVALGQPYSKSCDAFSYGMVLFELMTRSKPLKRGMKTTTGNLLDVEMEKWKPKLPGEVPEALFKIFEECVAYKPEDRPTFRDVIKKLDVVAKEFKGKEPVKLLGGGTAAPAKTAAAPPGKTPPSKPVTAPPAKTKEVKGGAKKKDSKEDKGKKKKTKTKKTKKTK